jgi:predicted amidohydrolase
MKISVPLRFTAPAGLFILGLATAFPSSADMSAPEGWRTFAVRSEIAPHFWVEPEPGNPQGYLLGIAGKGNDAADGRWIRTVPAPQGKFYSFIADYRPESVATPFRSVLARIVWLDAQGKQIEQPEYPFPSEGAEEKWRSLRGTYESPPGAVQARIELHLRWAANGKVLWRPARLKEASPPSSRKVRLASINHRPQRSPSPERNLEAFLRQVDEAARLKVDIVCLPEGITVVGTGKKYADVAEEIPGPSTRRLGESAAKHRIYIVAGIYERDGNAIYNTSVLLSRQGDLIGRYRKVCLPHEEIEGGLTPGNEYPVFDTDFGRVGMMICWDLHFPEVARELAAKGAEVIFIPIWGGNEVLARARAIENQVFLVASGYDFKTAIYDKAGKTLAEANGDPGVIVADIDLSQRLLWPWLGEWRARIWREAPPRK